jgi:hypothetical protein
MQDTSLLEQSTVAAASVFLHFKTAWAPETEITTN